MKHSEPTRCATWLPVGHMRGTPVRGRTASAEWVLGFMIAQRMRVAGALRMYYDDVCAGCEQDGYHLAQLQCLRSTLVETWHTRPKQACLVSNAPLRV